MNKSKPTLMIVDGHSLAFRAFYGAPVDAFVTTSGQHTNAVHAFISMLLVLLEKYNPDSLAIAFDISRHSFRTEEYPEYKGARRATPEEFKGQVPLLKEVLEAMGIVTVEKQGYEADDILATLATAADNQGYAVYVVSGDRDTIQLVNENVTLLYPGALGVKLLKEYTPAAVVEKYGIKPEQYPDMAALVGETSDNLPGIPKVGEKTAAKWINEYGSLAEILANKDSIKGKVGENLRENAHLAERNRRLNRLLRDVELPFEISDLARGQIDMARVTPVLRKLEFRSVLRRVAKFAGEVTVADLSDPELAGAANTAAVSLQAEFPDPQLLLDEELEAWLHRDEAKSVFIAPDRERASGKYTVGLATVTASVEFSWLPGGSDYQGFAKWLASESAKQVWDAKKLSHELASLGVQLNGVTADAQLALNVLRPDINEKNFAKSCGKFLGEEVTEEQIVAGEIGAAKCAWLVLRLNSYALSNLDTRSERLYREIELPLTAVLASLEERGIAIDLPVLEGHRLELKEQVAELERKAYAAINQQINLASPKQLQKVLFEDLALPPSRKIKSGYSTDAKSIKELQLAHPHPFLEALIEHREKNKLAQMVQTLIDSISPADNKIHTTLLQIGAVTGRLASTAPNLQNIPTRSFEGERIRGAFTYDDAYDCLLTADYSQIEMRIMAHLSNDEGLIAAFKEGEDLHRSVGARVFGVAPADVNASMRAKVKAMSYGLTYGLGVFGLASQLNISQAEAKQLMSDYFNRFGGVRDYLRSVVEQARTKGYTETIFGRRRLFPELKSSNRVVRQNAERAALNAPIQGSASDIIKIAMLAIEKRLAESKLRSRMVLQIHDELMFEAAMSELETLQQIVREEMSAAAQLLVPLEVSLGVGANWQLAAH
ncbi:DNA polymerase I [Canibacter zhuwentaonis]|uniref:DNA polymerase I n=1 Tax=Canibacter zhuwentaonis TaxID=2837491 RepID=UPI003D6DB2F5